MCILSTNMLLTNTIYILNNRSSNGSFLPLQFATDDVLAERNPAYNTKPDIHTYDYIPGDGMIMTIRVDQSPPELPPDRNVHEKDANHEGKG